MEFYPKFHICHEEYNTKIWKREFFTLIILLICDILLSFMLQFLQIKAVIKHIDIYHVMCLYLHS